MVVVDLDRLESDGWVKVAAGVPPDLVAEASAWLDRRTEDTRSLLSMQVEREAGGRLRKLRRLYWLDPGFWGPWVAASGVAELARRIVGDDAVLVKNACFTKPPGGARVGYHQDRALWDGEMERAHNFWVPLDRADRATGGLVMFSGTQRMGLLPHAPAEDHPWHPVVEPDGLGLEPTAVEVEVGEVMVHQARTLHGSPPNASDRPRRAVTFTFAAEPPPGDPATAREGWVRLDDVVGARLPA